MAQAQTVTTGVPGFISYQGRVLDSTGALVGTGTPVNRTVTFRVWDHPSNIAASNLIYSEEQTVTISEGEFSVLVGQGVATTTSPFTFPEADYGPPTKAIADAFNGSGRYLGVTVDDGTTAVDNEISPRQQVVSSAFAFRAKFAETLGTSTNSNVLNVLDSGRVGIGTVAPTHSLQVAGSVAARSTTAADGYVTMNAGSAAQGGFLEWWNPGNSRIAYMGFNTTDLRLNLESGKNFIIANGNVGIGTASPNGKLDIAGYLRVQGGGDQTGTIALGNRASPGYYDTGIFRGAAGSLNPGNFLNVAGYEGIAFNTSANSFGNAATRMLIHNNGRVGIGITGPRATLDLVGSGGDTAYFSRPGGITSHVHNGTNGDIYWRSSQSAGKVILQDTGGNVGIGTSAPSAKLDVAGAIRATGPIRSYNAVAAGPQLGENGGGGQRLILWPGSATEPPFGFGIQGSAMWSAVPTSGHHLWYENTTERMRIMPGGAVGIGTTGPADKLDVNGVIRGHGFRCRAAQNGTVSGHAFNFDWSGSAMAAYIDASFVGWVGGTSDRRLKEKIQPMKGGAIERVMALKPASFKYKNIPGTIFTGDDQTKEGFIADELQQIVPSAVTGKKDAVTEDGKIQPQVISDTPIVALLTKAVQEQQQTIQKQQDEIDALKAAVKALVETAAK
jgi:hypothetical protein